MTAQPEYTTLEIIDAAQSDPEPMRDLMLHAARRLREYRDESIARARVPFEEINHRVKS